MRSKKKAVKRQLQKKAGAKRSVFRFPRELKGASREKMLAFVNRLSDARLEQIVLHYRRVEKRSAYSNRKLLQLPKRYPALEDLAQYAMAEKMARYMKKKKQAGK